MALTHVPQGHDRETFFRRIFFRAERWRRSRDAKRVSELADIAAEVEIGDDRMGSYRLTLVYRPYRKDRGRATTVLGGESRFSRCFAIATSRAATC